MSAGLPVRGSLSRVPPAALIRAIHASQRSGVLHLTREAVSKRIYFKDGSIILAGSDLYEERMGQALLRTGKVNQSDLDEALHVMEKTGRAIGETIGEMGLLRAEEIQLAATRRTKSIVESVLDWDSGEYSFETRHERLEGELLSEIPVPETLLEGIRKIRSSTAIRRLLGEGKAVPRRVEDSPFLPDQRSFTPSEAWVLPQVNGLSSVAEIATLCPLGEEEALRSLCGLLLAGFIDFDRPPPSLPADLAVALEQERREALLSPAPPKKLGRYVVQEAIGRGSMGAVLLARDPEIDRAVAIKLIQTSVHLTPPEWEKYKERFYREARAAGKLLHPGIVTVFDVGHSVEGVPFIVMEYVEGRTLDALAKAAELGVEEALRLAGECLQALEYAHVHGIVHRDLKPANILVTGDGHPKIMDFGVAHVVGSEITHAGEILGSPYYMAPEQFGKGPVDQRTDLFAFGVVLYWMLTGKFPFAGDSFVAIAEAITSEKPVRPEKINSAIPPALGRIVLRCLEKDPARRFSNAGELGEALSAIGKAKQRPPARRRVAAGVALALLVGAGLVSLFLGLVPSRAPESQKEPKAPPTPGTTAEPRKGGRADPLHEARLAAERGQLESSKKMLQEILRKSPKAVGAAELLSQVDDRLWRKSLPLTFTAKHSHRIGACTGTLKLDAWGIEYRSEVHPPWRWRFDEIRALEREDSRRLQIQTNEKEVLALGKPKSYSFSLLNRPLGGEDWAKYRRLAR